MSPWITVAIAAFALVAGIGSLILHRRAGRARRELAQSIHDHTHALDQRCDVIQQQLVGVVRRQRIDHLTSLLQISEHQGCLDGATVRSLERFVLALGEEPSGPLESADGPH